MSDQHLAFGIGPTENLSLRVSVAALVRLLFAHPDTGEPMLALERRGTTWRENGQEVAMVKSHPFGGAIRIHDLLRLRDAIGDFQFDSENSRFEQDFRLFIRPSAWESMRRFCWQHFSDPDNHVLETGPQRELEEEFLEGLQIKLLPDQFTVRLRETLIEEEPSPTENIRAQGHPTARIYRIFEAYLHDTSLATALVRHSEMYSDQDLILLARERSSDGGVGMFNTVLALPNKGLLSFYPGVPLERRNTPLTFQDHCLDETVAAILGIGVPKYKKEAYG